MVCGHFASALLIGLACQDGFHGFSSLLTLFLGLLTGYLLSFETRLLGFLLLLLLALLLVGLVLLVGNRETFVGLLQELRVVIKCLEIDLSVQIDRSLGIDVVSECTSILSFRTSFPVISTVVGSICIEPVKARNLVEWYLIAGLHGLVVVEGTAEVSETDLHRVLPSLVEIGIEILVYLHVRLFHLGSRAALELEMEGLEDIPPQLETTIPEEILTEGSGHSRVVSEVIHISLLNLIVVAVEIRVEGDALGAEREILLANEIKPLTLRLQVLEGFPSIPSGTPRIVHTTLPSLLMLIDSGLSFTGLGGVAVVKGEVGRIIRHGVFLAGDVHPDSTEGQVLGFFRRGY